MVQINPSSKQERQLRRLVAAKPVASTTDEAAKYREEDEANKSKTKGKNGLENYCFAMRNTLQEARLKDKFESGDIETLEKAV
jgi:hypothetical protein